MESTNLPTKFNLLLLSAKYNFIDINKKDSYNDNPFELLISECSKKEKEKIIKIKKEKIFDFYYIYKKVIDDKILIPDDILRREIIIDQNFEINFHNYLILAFLLDGYYIINYIYDKKMIDEFNKIENKGEFNFLIRVKIIQILIKYYKDIPEQYEITDIEKKNLNDIMQNYLDRLSSDEFKNKLKKYKLEYTRKDIFNSKLEDIYINIVFNVLLKSECNEDNIKKFINEIDLENIPLTKSMLQKMINFYKSEEVNKSINSDENKEKIINFYYYFCKYILKKNYYIIYQNEFSFELKEKIKSIIFKENQNLSEKLKYIKDFFIIKEETKNIIFVEKNYFKIQEPNKLNNTRENNSDNFNNKDKKIETKTNQIDLLIYKGRIMFDKTNNTNKAKQILELGNNYFVKLDINNNIFIYSHNEYKEMFSLYNNDNNNDNREVIDGLTKSNDNNYIVAICNKKFIYFNIDNKIQESAIIRNTHKFFQFFEISIKENIIKYITLGDTGLYIKTNDDDSNEDEKDRLKSELIGGIKITDNLYSFYSNKNFFEENIIIPYDISNKKKYRLDGDNNQNCSYPSDNNELHLININDNYKILLCACKSYKSGDKNGILLVKIYIKKSTYKIPELFDTEDFKINCFCTIYENKEEHFEYFLAGGFEKNKKRSTVKLYKISYKIFKEDIQIEIKYIKDAIEDFNKINFDGSIYKIIKTDDNEKNIGNIIIHCKNGSIYLFKLNDNNKTFS